MSVAAEHEEEEEEETGGGGLRPLSPISPATKRMRLLINGEDQGGEGEGERGSGSGGGSGSGSGEGKERPPFRAPAEGKRRACMPAAVVVAGALSEWGGVASYRRRKNGETRESKGVF